MVLDGVKQCQSSSVSECVFEADILQMSVEHTPDLFVGRKTVTLFIVSLELKHSCSCQPSDSPAAALRVTAGG